MKDKFSYLSYVLYGIYIYIYFNSPLSTYTPLQERRISLRAIME